MSDPDAADPLPGAADPAPVTSPVTPNPWQALRRFTAARIALGRSGVSLPTQPHLAFQLAHAQARDAVHLALDAPALLGALNEVGAWAAVEQAALLLHSAAVDRDTYLQRPDLGRRLSTASREVLLARLPAVQAQALAGPGVAPDTPEQRRHDIAFVVADGLSALAIGHHAVPFLRHILPMLQAQGWSVAPLVLVMQGRVAVADEIGELLRARLVVILIGERPGLSSPDSMGLYLTWMPRVGLSDASRNCISNVRPAGLQFDAAARKLIYLLSQARQRRLSGVALKDEAHDTDVAHRTLIAS
jgi:ethanolamine ammonia-lyase small subunit